MPGGGRLSALDRFTPSVLLLLAFVYSALFISPNLVGADDHDMLAVASGNGDNIYMYDCLVNMRPGRSFSETLHNVLYYDWYFYGYPFFLFSRLATLPSTPLIRTGMIDPTHVVSFHMLAVKQLASVYVVMASGILVNLWTGFKSFFHSVFLFLFLLSIPLVFGFNMFWHPESLATLFVVLTIAALAKDALRFGRWFGVAAIFCGFAVGVKVIGIFFFPTIAVYLAFGWLKKCGARRVSFNVAGDAASFFLLYGTLFLLLMIAGLVITNPLIVLPEILSQYLNYAKASIEWVREEVLLRQLMQPGAAKSWSAVLSTNCGRWWMYALIAGISIFGMVSDCRTKLLNVIIMTWALPFGTYLICVGAPDRPYYFLSIILPLMSSVGSPAIWQWWTHRSPLRRRFALLALVATLALCGLEARHYIEVDRRIYKGGLDRKKNSEAVTAGLELDRVYLSLVPHDGSVRILRDDPIGLGPVYVPQIGRFDVRKSAGLMKYEDVDTIKPRLIILLRSSIEFYSSEKFLRYYSGYPEDTLSRSFGHHFIRASYQFYRDAKENQLNAYHRVWSSDYAVAFERD